MNEPLQISSSFVVLSKNFDAETVKVSDKLYPELDERYGDFAGRLLISSHLFEEDWPTWEIHPHGDEFVILIAGEADMVFAANDGDQTVRLSEPGSFVIVPRGTWHTAKVREPTQMMFITPGQDTDNRKEPVRNGC